MGAPIAAWEDQPTFCSRAGWKVPSMLTRIIHERFHCNRRYVAATSLAVVVSRPGGQALPL